MISAARSLRWCGGRKNTRVFSLIRQKSRFRGGGGGVVLCLLVVVVVLVLVFGAVVVYTEVCFSSVDSVVCISVEKGNRKISEYM